MADQRSTVEPVEDVIIHRCLKLPIPPDQAFSFFTRNDALESWLAPVADVQPETGARYELFWTPEDRENNSTIGCRVTAVEQDQLIAFQWRSPKQFKSFANTADPLTHVVVTFVPEGEATSVHLVHSGWRSTPEWQEARAWQERAWDVALESLKEQASTS